MNYDHTTDDDTLLVEAFVMAGKDQPPESESMVILFFSKTKTKTNKQIMAGKDQPPEWSMVILFLNFFF